MNLQRERGLKKREILVVIFVLNLCIIFGVYLLVYFQTANQLMEFTTKLEQQTEKLENIRRYSQTVAKQYRGLNDDVFLLQDQLTRHEMSIDMKQNEQLQMEQAIEQYKIDYNHTASLIAKLLVASNDDYFRYHDKRTSLFQKCFANNTDGI